jgi:serine/threonine protein kinase
MYHIEQYINNLNINNIMDNNKLLLINKDILDEIELYKINNINYNKIMDEYLNNIEIKICDFNLSIEYDLNNKDNECQTRYYRAPELILGYNFNNKSDYWSIPCIIFELLTGDILFNPEKTELITTDIAHLYLIIELLGDIPQNMIKNCPNYKLLFKNNKLININKKIKSFKLIDVMKEYDLNINDEYLNKLFLLMDEMLKINPSERNNLDYYIKKYF